MAGAGYFGSGVVYRPIDQKQRAIVLHKLSSGFARPPRPGDPISVDVEPAAAAALDIGTRLRRPRRYP